MKPWYMHQFTAVFSNDFQICIFMHRLFLITIVKG